MIITHRFVSMTVACILLFYAASVRAEGFIDVYAGTTSTNKGHSEISGTGGSLTGDIEYKSSFTGGARGGAWFKYVGVAIDAFYFKTDSKDGDATQDNLAIGFDLMGRLPLLTSEDIPQGRVQPYVTAGPAIFTSTLKVPGFSDAQSAKLGYKLGAGLKVLFTKHIGLFGEYRYTYVESEHEFRGNPSIGVIGSANLTQQIGSHHFVAGLAFHF